MRRSAVFLMAGACVAGVGPAASAATLTEIFTAFVADFSGGDGVGFSFAFNDDSLANFYANGASTTPINPALINEATFAGLVGTGAQARGVFEISNLAGIGSSEGGGTYNSTTAGLMSIPEVTGDYTLTLTGYNVLTNIATFDASFRVFEDSVGTGNAFFNPVVPGGEVSAPGTFTDGTLFADLFSDSYLLEIDFGPLDTLSFQEATGVGPQALDIIGGTVATDPFYNSAFVKPSMVLSEITIDDEGYAGYAFNDNARLTLTLVPSPVAAGPAFLLVGALAFRRRRED